jgi:hypothetical protein
LRQTIAASRKRQAQGHDGAGHLLTLCRYVERNALRAGMVRRAEDWPWSSLHARLNPMSPAARLVRLYRWPVDEPADWVAWVNEPQTDGELERAVAAAPARTPVCRAPPDRNRMHPCYPCNPRAAAHGASVAGEGRYFSFVNATARPARLMIISLLAALNSKVTFPPKS